MNHFEIKDGVLHAEDCAVDAIARSVGTPVYIYSEATLRRHYRVFSQALGAHQVLIGPSGAKPLVAYAVKANSNLSVLKILGSEGAGADTVSEGEIRRALSAGIDPLKIIFSGVGKTNSELDYALKAAIGQFNVESESELFRLSQRAEALGVIATVTLRINPKIGAGGHAEITTGGEGDKFGLTPKDALRLYGQALPHIEMCGLSCHIGSQITDLSPLRATYMLMKGWVEQLRGEGHRVDRLDLGGGLGVPYFQSADPPHPTEFAQMVAEVMGGPNGGLGLDLIFEPGRLIAANAGILVSEVVSIHHRPNSGPSFLVVDAAMNDLLRPALYEAFHEIRPVCPQTDAVTCVYDVVGPVCETGDTFARNRALPQAKMGDLLAFMTAGAYGAVMSSEYNTRPLVPEILVSGANWTQIRKRPSYEDIFAREPIANWLETKSNSR
jgi:diaminopimelate decarboxylase